jgi:hypothetical protein
MAIRPSISHEWVTAISGTLEKLRSPWNEDAQELYCRSNCGQFEDTDENKLVYTVGWCRFNPV